jgi:ATP-dependent exoDNAse (exonuclease V) beta subunit
MLGLLARVENPEEVVAITFTRKAAAEMSHRLVKALQDASRDAHPEIEPHQQVSRELALAVLKNNRERGWNLLEQPSRLRIRTIDGLCSELARQLPVLSGLGGGQQVTEDASALYRKAAARTLAAIEDSGDELQSDVIRVLDRYDNQYDRLVELLTSMLGHREQWTSHLLRFQGQDGFDRRSLEQSLGLLIGAELRTARENLPDHLLAGLPRYLNYALSNLPGDETEAKALLEDCGGVDCCFLDLPTTPEALPHWVTMVSYLLTKGGTWLASVNAGLGFPAPSGARGEEKARRKEWKDGFTELLDSLRDNDILCRQLNTIRKLPNAVYDDEAWETLESLMRILLRAAVEWKVVMSETGEADFSEIATRAIQSLGTDGEPSSLALRMDYRIQHLLVDEFQDTSNSQIRLFERLTAGWSDGDGRTLFLVGDPVQSIYRFRKAEVTQFIRAFNGKLFQHVRLRPLQLQVNFRSAKPIVDWVNQAFPQVMPANSDPVNGAVHYSGTSARPGAPGHGTVSTRMLPVRDDEMEAHQVVEAIRHCDPGETVAILVRSRTHANAILTLLDQLKEGEPRFRYRAIDFTPLADTPLVQDLVSLTLAMIQPADRLAWLATLRAPYCGLDLSDLDQLAAAPSGNTILDSVAASLNPEDQDRFTLSVEGRQRLQRAGPVLLQAANRRGRESVRTLLESTWTRLGGPACTQNDSELADAAAYFDLIDDLERENLPIDHDTLDQRLENLYAEPDSRAGNHLQVMTIYAAKGLQFDTVILPGLNRGTGGDKGKLLHWFELPGEDLIVMSPMRNSAEKEKQKHAGDLIQFISDVEKRSRRFEDGRLLYVASTRAIHSLYLFAAVPPRKNGDIEANSGTLLAELWPAIEAREAPLIRLAAQALEEAGETGPGAAAKAELQTPLPQHYRRLAADWQLPEPPGSVHRGRAGQADAHDYIEFSWAGEEARLTGNLVHRLLQMIGELGLEAWSASDGMARRDAWCRRRLASEGVRGEKADSIVARTSLAINNCLGSDRGKWILDAHEGAECEYALTVVLDGQPRNLVLDRSFIADGSRWIIDYKTSSHSGGDLEGFLENEAGRYLEQLRRYKEAVAINESRPIRTALYFPLLDRFREV